MNRNGVIRDMVNLGVLQLPQRTRAHSAWHVAGHYFTMRFYSSPYVLKDIDRHLRVDPRMVRHNVIKLGSEYSYPNSIANERLKDMARIPGDYTINHQSSSRRSAFGEGTNV